ncbi:Os02g0754400 [Oryza sativa Japonica Group]|jgi:hypothetical protein|uniref:Os02g0754400 protein n=1 Tax=Oryza sativa subsp. japonica TaxID=39947 RepID=Q0DXH0_ORYSJ|nr:Os02g0754400 [Oryza sativa Japonica Group]|eukprot:NP_001048154.2 Os02g0754400 [Oryza sativa Japonica Group]
MGRSPCCDENGLKKGPWTTEEDEKLMEYIQKNGHGSWRALPKLAGLNRCGKSCRLRWTNYLRPDIKRGKFTSAEKDTILQLHAVLGNKYVLQCTAPPHQIHSINMLFLHPSTGSYLHLILRNRPCLAIGMQFSDTLADTDCC